MSNLFGKKLRMLRETANLTQKDIADRLHLDRSTYTYYETGKTQPTCETLMELARLHGVSVDFLLGAKQSSINIEKRFFLHFLDLTEEEQTALLRRLEDLAEK